MNRTAATDAAFRHAERLGSDGRTAGTLNSVLKQAGLKERSSA
jgi:hypothetical protein